MKHLLFLSIVAVLGVAQNSFSDQDKSSAEYWNETSITKTNVTFFVNQKKCYSNKAVFIGCLEALNALPTTLSTSTEGAPSKRYLFISKAYAARYPQLVLKVLAEYGALALTEVVSIFSPEEMKVLTSRVYFEKTKKNSIEYHTTMLELFSLNQKINFEALVEDVVSKLTINPQLSKLAYGEAINEYLKYAYDPHTAIAPTAQEEAQMSGDSKAFSGIGAAVSQANGAVVIDSVFENSPAERAGVEPGDIITHINGFSVEGLKVGPVVKSLRGPEGTQVKMTVSRDGKSIELVIIREKLESPNVTAKVVSDFGAKVFYIKLNQFSKNACWQIGKNYAIAQVFNSNINKVILDLRNNPGGYLREAVCIGKLFAGNDKRIVYEKDLNKNSFEEADPYENNHLPYSLEGKAPMVVLVNGGSASASEVVSGALQDYKTAWIVGERTFGKGTVQSVMRSNPNDYALMAEFNLPADVTVKKTVQRFYSPRLISNQAIGIRPDIVVSEKPGLDDEKRYAPREEDIFETIISGVSESRPPLRTTEIWAIQSQCLNQNRAEKLYEEKLKLKKKADYQLLKAQELLSCEEALADVEVSPHH